MLSAAVATATTTAVVNSGNDRGVVSNCFLLSAAVATAATTAEVNSDNDRGVVFFFIWVFSSSGSRSGNRRG